MNRASDSRNERKLYSDDKPKQTLAEKHEKKIRDIVCGTIGADTPVSEEAVQESLVQLLIMEESKKYKYRSEHCERAFVAKVVRQVVGEILDSENKQRRVLNMLADVNPGDYVPEHRRDPLDIVIMRENLDENIEDACRAMHKERKAAKHRARRTVYNRMTQREFKRRKRVECGKGIPKG